VSERLRVREIDDAGDGGWFYPAGQFQWLLIAETGPAAERLRVREIEDDEGRRLVRIVRRGSGSVMTWRPAQTVLLSAQGMAGERDREGRVHQRAWHERPQ
jgi:hypothetical protein